MDYPYSERSWYLLEPNIALKVVDKSFIQNKETGVPQGIAHFFPQALCLNQGEAVDIDFSDQGKGASVRLRNTDGRLRIRLKNHSIPKDLAIGDEVAFEHVNEQLKITYLTASNSDKELSLTEKAREVKTRIGQQEFRKNVIAVCSAKCVVTGIKFEPLLIASHIKSWKESNDNERLDGHNGLLLVAHIDKLFDKHLISFDENGYMLVSHKVPTELIQELRIDVQRPYELGARQLQYLEAHRAIFNTQNAAKS